MLSAADLQVKKYNSVEQDLESRCEVLVLPFGDNGLQIWFRARDAC